MEQQISSESPSPSERTEQNIPPHVLSELTPEILEKLPEETKVAVIEAISFKGPLPPPSLFRQYEETLPGSSERIMQLTEKEQAHRHSWEDKTLDYEGKEITHGQLFGFILGVLAICGGLYCASIDQSLVAISLVSTSLAGILTAFIKGRSE